MRIDTPTNASAQRGAPKRTSHSAGRGTRHIARLLAAVLGFVVVCADGLGAAAAPLTKKPLNQQDKPLVVVSLGDSYSSGEGLEEFDKEVAPEGDIAEKARIIAHRSTQSWPGLLTFTDASGATVQLKDYYCPPSADGIRSGEGTPPIDGTEDNSGATDKTDKAGNSGATDKAGIQGAKEASTPAVTGKARREIYWYSIAASGATTSALNASHPRILEGLRFCLLPPQSNVFSQLPARPDYVTVTFGGNDAHFGEVIAACIALSKGTTLQKLLDQIWEEFYDDTLVRGSIQSRLRKVYTQICASAGPQASVIVVGYPTLLSSGGLLVNKTEAQLVNDAIHEFNKQIELLVTSCREEDGMNIYYVSVEEEFAGHEAYTKDPYLFPVVFNEDISSFKDLTREGLVHYKSMHPNEKGTAAYARCVQKKIDELEQAKKAQKQTRYPAVYRAPRILFDIPKHHYELTA